MVTLSGAEPVKRALEDGQEYITLTAHELAEKIDAGRILAEQRHPVRYKRSHSLAQNVERIKREMLPLYPRVALEAIERCLDERQRKGR